MYIAEFQAVKTKSKINASTCCSVTVTADKRLQHHINIKPENATTNTTSITARTCKVPSSDPLPASCCSKVSLPSFSHYWFHLGVSNGKGIVSFQVINRKSVCIKTDRDRFFTYYGLQGSDLLLMLQTIALFCSNFATEAISQPAPAVAAPKTGHRASQVL